MHFRKRILLEYMSQNEEITTKCESEPLAKRIKLESDEDPSYIQQDTQDMLKLMQTNGNIFAPRSESIWPNSLSAIMQETSPVPVQRESEVDVRRIFHSMVSTLLRLRKKSMLGDESDPSEETKPLKESSKKKAKRVKTEFFYEEGNNGEVQIGPAGTTISRESYEKISWSKPAAATRALLMILFRREELATHTLTGKPSPAFLDQGKPTKAQLHPKKVNDIIYVVMKKSGASLKEVRNIITTKCADENKMCRMRKIKTKKISNV